MVAAYLPEVWNDDVTMHSLMSVIKERTVNKVDYDRKVKFWSELIFDSCVGEKNAIFDLALLKTRFRRGDRVPASLPVVLEYIKKTNGVQTLSEWRDNHSGWLGWGLSKTRNWMFGVSNDNEKYVHVHTIKKLSSDVLKIYNDEFRSEVDCTGEVVTYNEFFERVQSIVDTTETFDLVLEYLTDIGELTIGTTTNGEKVLKFKDHGSKDPVKFTATDASLVDIRKAMTKLDREIQQLEEKAKKYDQQCRTLLRSGDKQRAQNFLRQRKRAEKDIADKDAQHQKLLGMLHQISAAKNNKDVLRAYQSGTAAFKATLAKQGLTPDRIHETMDDVASSLDEYREIEEAISSPFVDRATVNDEELEQELNDLMSAHKSDESLHLPEAPTNRFGLFENQDEEETEQQQLERRLAKLRETA